MKKLFLLIALNILVLNTQAQFVWAKAEGLWAYDYGYGIGTDNSGNVYVAGKYEENGAIFSGNTITCAGNHDLFVAKYDPAGGLTWIKTGGGPNGDYAEALACDGTNLYVSGEIEGYGTTINFPGSAVTLQCVGDNDAFLAKYDLSGNLLWAISEGYLNSEKAIGVTYDNSGNIYICGYFTTQTRFNGTMHSGYGGRDIYVAKYSANGVFQWIRYAGSSGRDEAKAVKCDASGNVYICGMHSNNCNFDGQMLSSPNGYYNSYLAKYNSSGDLQWVKTAGGDYDEVGWSLVLDNAGKIFVAGEFNASAEFGSIQLITSGNADAFVACYDDGGTVQWVKKAGGPLIDRARGIGTDGTYLFITGQFGSNANFGSTTVSAPDSSDIFIASLDNLGNFIGAYSVNGSADAVETLGYESGNAICAQAGNIYATGGLLNGGVFGATSVNGYGRTDVFVAKVATTIIGIPENARLESISIYPNPVISNFVIDISNLKNKKAEVSIYNCLGMLVDKKVSDSNSKINVDMTSAEEGVYLVEILLEDKTIFRKKLIVQN